MAGVVEELGGRALLDDAPGVHHRDAVGEVGDDGEVVRDVERGDLVRVAQLADRRRARALGC